MSASNAGRIGVWGASGSGKSAYVTWKIRQLKRVVVFDPLDSYSTQRMTRCTTVDQVRKAMMKNWKTFRIAYVPPATKEPRALHQLCLLLMKAQQPFKDRGGGAGVTLVVEEMNLAFPVHGGDAKCPGFAEICSRGRHFGIEAYGLSQRIAEVSTRFRGNLSETVILRQEGRTDVKAAQYASRLPEARINALENKQLIICKAGQFTCGKLSFKNNRPHVTLSNGT